MNTKHISQGILNSAKDIIANRKNEAESKCRKNIQTLMQNEEFAKLYKDEQTAIIENTRCEVENLKKPYDLSQYKKNKEDFLKKHNIDISKLKPDYFCKKCNDTGFLTDNSECNCLKMVINDLLRNKSNAPLTMHTFKDSQKFLSTSSVENQKIYKKMQDWCNNNSTKYDTITIIGNTGVGKTCLAECMADCLIQNDHIIYWNSAFKLNYDFEQYNKLYSNAPKDSIVDYLECEYLFIDDVGSTKQNSMSSVDSLYIILNERQSRGLKTILTTNCDFDKIEEYYGERILSRLANNSSSIVIELKNDDLRLKKN